MPYHSYEGIIILYAFFEQSDYV